LNFFNFLLYYFITKVATMATTSDDELEYLAPGFDPSTLTVPRLRSILVSHDISYSASAKKSQLIDIFNEKLVPRSRKLLKERAKVRRTSAGIETVPSSQESTATADEDEVPSLPVADTRSKRSRSTRASTYESLEDPTPRKTPGRRRTTRTPAEVETPVAEPPTVGPSARSSRKSTAVLDVKNEDFETPKPKTLDESPFSNDNPFQSGSSPLVQTEKRRKSESRKTESSVRKSTSRRRKTEEPYIKQEDADDFGVPTSSKTVQLPVSSLRKSSVKKEPHATVEAGEEFTEEEQRALTREGDARNDLTTSRSRRRIRKAKQNNTLRHATTMILTVLLGIYAVWWRKEKIEVGFCGVGKPATTLANLQVPEWLDFLQPQCESCPQHAYCYYDMEVRCERGFVQRLHPLSLGGLIPLLPTCEPDGEQARKVQAVADRAVEELRDRRAKFECGELSEDGTKVKTVEIPESSLKATVSAKRRRTMTDEEFEDLWKGAIDEITNRDEVSKDNKG
jgi:hypothetical protein